ncbi:MAG: CoA-binding protein [Bacteroidota bacterium]|nr:MAG: CoA-binding protein [Bacteroidota bacterium]
MSPSETIVLLGASANPNRPGYLAGKFLKNKGFNLYAVAQKKGIADGLEIHDTSNPPDRADTVSVFLNPDRQRSYYTYILKLHPWRIIFNPGTENPELVNLARQHDIQVVTGCTIALMMNGLL